ncbi:MAG TPA: uroporphyrinogen-III synthase [Burkholderiaceae bacterium]|nr:uroporphyrinogen-III synthase [Burkholderiaceae bacterium]
MHTIVTRPERDAQRWVQALRERGLDALALPLMEIAAADDPKPLHAAWQSLGHYDAVMFVSGNAVEQFFAAKPHAIEGWCIDNVIQTRAWAPGPGTAAALQKAGVAAVLTDAPRVESEQFDSEALWQVVRAQVHVRSRVLIVRGADAEGQGTGRGWLERQLVAAGAQVDKVEAYMRRPPHWSAERQRAAAQAARDGSVWLFSSSEAVANLVSMLPAQTWAAGRAVATHPRIAQAVRSAGFGVVWESRPTLDAVVASIESVR